jgi:hypothetical protein
VKTALRIALLGLTLAAMGAGLSAQSTEAPAGGGPSPPIVCPFGEQACRGAFGQGCYRPSAGQHCTAGQVCGVGEQACVGPHGQGCYQPSAGQHCTQGWVCGPGERACVRPGRAQCYKPSAGQTCQ